VAEAQVIVVQLYLPVLVVLVAAAQILIVMLVVMVLQAKDLLAVKAAGRQHTITTAVAAEVLVRLVQADRMMVQAVPAHILQ
jgi:hypothetical protein